MLDRGPGLEVERPNGYISIFIELPTGCALATDCQHLVWFGTGNS
jgi:hypothetical protein